MLTSYRHAADAALVLNQEGDVCRQEGQTGADAEQDEMRQLVKRVVLQRQQSLDDENSDFDSD